MSTLKEHIAFKITILLLVVTLFTPSAVKFVHIFAHHTHEVCNGEQTTHIHKIDLDCEFHKFQLNTNFTFTVFNVELFLDKKEPYQIVSQYHFLSKYQRLHISLRGPPSLI